MGRLPSTPFPLKRPTSDARDVLYVGFPLSFSCVRCVKMASSARKRKVLSVDEKVQIIDAIVKGEKKKDVAARFGIPANSLSTVLKSKENILAAVAAGTSTTRKKLRRATYDDVDKAMFTWFLEMLATQVPLTGAILQRQALNFANMLGCDDFRGSSGWLEKFKMRHAIVSRALCGESLSADDVRAAA